VSPRRGLLAALVAATGIALLLPGIGGPLRRLAKVDGDGPEPRYEIAIDPGAIRRAARTLPDDARYFVAVGGHDPLEHGNLKAAAQLFFAPALPVQDPAAAGWLLTYREEAVVPAGRVRRVIPLTAGMALVELGRR
jgi:hypothetical protein